MSEHAVERQPKQIESSLQAICGTCQAVVYSESWTEVRDDATGELVESEHVVSDHRSSHICTGAPPCLS